MKIIACMKWIPDTSEAELTIASNGKDIKKDDLDYDLNDWDRFAIEEAVQLKEKYEGEVTAVSVAPEDAEEMLRECLARGADRHSSSRETLPSGLEWSSGGMQKICCRRCRLQNG